MASIQDSPPTADSDETLAVRALTDRAAFGLLYDRYAARVYRYCVRRMGDRSEAEDATSATFIRALERLDAFRGGSFAAWLFAIARTTCIDRLRKPRPQPLDDHVELRDPGLDPADRAERAADAQEIRAMLSVLSADQRDVIELRLAGLSGAEIAAATGRSTPAVKMLQLRAMKRLRVEAISHSIPEEL